MTKRILASALAASIALTSVTALPARAADVAEIGRFMVGAGALFILGAALSDADRRNKVTRHVTPAPRVVKPQRKIVPASCLRQNHYAQGPKRFVGQHCVNKRMRNAHLLPNNCVRSVLTNRGYRHVYSARCLRRNGWAFG